MLLLVLVLHLLLAYSLILLIVAHIVLLHQYTHHSLYLLHSTTYSYVVFHDIAMLDLYSLAALPIVSLCYAHAAHTSAHLYITLPVVYLASHFVILT